MNKTNSLGKLLNKVKELLNTRKKVTIFVVIALLAIFAGIKVFGGKKQSIQYQTAQAEKGTLVVSVSASGNITSGNNVNISTSASGTINQVFVKNGDKVIQGQKIATITPDRDTLQRQAQAWSSYLSAKNQIVSAQTTLWTLDSAMWAANKAFINDAVARGLATWDSTYIQENDNWLAAEAKYKSQQDVIAQSQASLSSAWYAYQQISSVITAPSLGMITNLTIAPGSLVSGSGSSTSSSSSLYVIGTISKEQQTQATVNLSEMDVVNVEAGQKVTMTMDAFPTKSFTGKVLVIDTNGQVSSGVTTYLATILFDSSEKNIYPNMAVDAKIITKVKTDVVLVPSSAIQTTNGESVVRIMNNNKVSQVTVEVGDSNDTQTEIVSGINEGDNVVTSVSTSTSTNSSSTSSPFGGLNRGFGGGGGAVRRVVGD